MADVGVSPKITEMVKYIKKPMEDDKSLYDHVSAIVDQSLTKRAKDCVNAFRFVKDTEPEPEDVIEYKQSFAKREMKLFEHSFEEIPDVGEREEEFELPLSNCYRIGYLFEKAGVGLGREEMIRVFLALKQLALECSFVNVRFWGKMFGIYGDYYIAETEYRIGEGDESPDEGDEMEILGNENYGITNNSELGDGPIEDDDLPKSTWKEPTEVQPENHHVGTNKNVYFVCNHLGESWTRLPHANPTEIVTSRRITWLLTGKLDSPIHTYPMFKGNEANYLRALIARISAGTQISPTGYFMFDNEDDEEDDEDTHQSFQMNAEFEGISPLLLADGTMSNWVHNKQYILPQGRCSWIDISKGTLNDFEDDDEDDDEEDNNLLAETGPQLLSSVSNDSQVENFPAWSAFLSSKILPKYAVALVRSNRWPGAYAISDGKMFDNIYIGWGKKYSGNCYNQEFPPPTFEEYVNIAEVTEMEDPTLEQENAFRELEENANRSADEIDNGEDDDEDE